VSNNTVAMEELQDLLEDLLAKRRITKVVSFDHTKNRIQYYTHIINICSSHVVSSFTSTPISYLAQLNIPLDPDYATYSDPDSDNESSHSDNNYQDFELDLPCCYSHQDSSGLQAWVKGIKHNPLRHAQRVIHLLHSSDKHRIAFLKLIQNGNEHGWFNMKDKDGKHIAGDVLELQLLRDVKTQWDSVYMMLMCLRVLQPVSSSWCLRWDW